MVWEFNGLSRGSGRHAFISAYSRLSWAGGLPFIQAGLILSKIFWRGLELSRRTIPTQIPVGLTFVALARNGNDATCDTED